MHRAASVDEKKMLLMLGERASERQKPLRAAFWGRQGGEGLALPSLLLSVPHDLPCEKYYFYVFLFHLIKYSTATLTGEVSTVSSRSTFMSAEFPENRLSKANEVG
jgi:hypothetical protein